MGFCKDGVNNGGSPQQHKLPFCQFRHRSIRKSVPHPINIDPGLGHFLPGFAVPPFVWILRAEHQLPPAVGNQQLVLSHFTGSLRQKNIVDAIVVWRKCIGQENLAIAVALKFGEYHRIPDRTATRLTLCPIQTGGLPQTVPGRTNRRSRLPGRTGKGLFPEPALPPGTAPYPDRG